ncbi:Inter-alpha-trypsin inhibitor heavy chain H3 [Anabarilius grahami]|uniref:Inter-alpha-trypsin inhibitor heavy chain H3 n=1 Tax=Anabarilius grahami TaxID=495550 RepID=A0A3N0XG38_ANAGA|nr:Inter-alpha-trypsin inhibitor heavy chain H3 [Anabarilius grahami]
MDRAALRLILLSVFLISASSQPVKKKQDVDIYSFYINSTVTSRYATTVITSRVANTLNESQEIQFEVKIPKTAFISKFRMTIEGKTYDGVVKEKQEAQQQYSEAVSRGQSAGLIKSVGRTLEDFKTSVTVAAFSKKQDVDIYSFYINSTVTSRYATTVITSRVANTLNESQEIQFEVKIPKTAFISKFRMTIEGKTYDGVVKEKQEAQQQYSEAVSRGQSAGLIKSVGRTLEDFKTSVTVAAFSKVTFELTYEELLKRRLGKYELLINAQPMQPLADFKMDVHIREKPGISFLEVKGDLSTGDLANAIKTTRADKDAWVTFYPTRDQQTKCKSCGENGLNGDLLITYDVERRNPKGEVMVSNGYFVHYFAPSDVPRISKNVVFIIDRSGSMRGRKMDQTRLALLRILSDLDEDDHFGLITFDHSVDTWKHELLKATEQNLKKAKSFVKEIRERGSETNIERIMANVKKAIGLKFPLYCLGFGHDVNFDFLTKMSLENGGVARRIYEDSDADLQLQVDYRESAGFYDEVAVPLLTDIQLKYTGGTNLTKTSFTLYFNGSEIVVSGQITDNSVESFSTEVIAVSKGSSVTYQDTVMIKDPSDVPPENEDFMQRLWAYLTVKQLLERQVLFKGQEKEDEEKEALKLSLKYQFVTPLTSMVVTKPQEDEVEVADKPKEGKEDPRPPAADVNVMGQKLMFGGFGLAALLILFATAAAVKAYCSYNVKQRAHTTDHVQTSETDYINLREQQLK